jgi:hypothetical protein
VGDSLFSVVSFVLVERRCFKLLGFDEYIDSHGDGLQILRYNLTKAYNSHMDWIEDAVCNGRWNQSR